MSGNQMIRKQDNRSEPGDQSIGEGDRQRVRKAANHVRKPESITSDVGKTIIRKRRRGASSESAN